MAVIPGQATAKQHYLLRVRQVKPYCPGFERAVQTIHDCKYCNPVHTVEIQVEDELQESSPSILVSFFVR